ncbi:MAG TPA: hypothetical protein VIM55_01335 [Mucilaginibacter sp.]
MKNCIIILLLFSVLQVKAQAKLFIDLTTEGQRTDFPSELQTAINTLYPAGMNKYYIIFAAHGSDPNSTAGHAWVVWFRDNQLTHQGEIWGYGFWPNYDQIKLNPTFTGLIVGTTIFPTSLLNTTLPGRLIAIAQGMIGGQSGGVPGVLRSDLINPETQNQKQIVFEVDKYTFEQSMSVVKDYTTKMPNYHLLKNDCVSFLAAVGRSIGLDMPDRNLLTDLPIKYLEALANELSNSAEKMTIYNGTGTVSASANGSYSTVFGDAKNSNVCTIDGSGSAVEVKTRNGAMSCTVSNATDGGILYSPAPSGPPLQTIHPSPGVINLNSGVPTNNLPSTDYSFPNGNLAFNYDPQNKQDQQCREYLSSGNQEFFGFINKDGQPNGVGTLSTQQKGSILTQTASFQNGNLDHYVALQFPEFTYSGALSNGLATGIGTINYKNGNSYTGNFDNGYFSGKGIAKIKNNKTGVIPLFDGNWQKGHFISGRITFPPGDYFEGTFSLNGDLLAGGFHNADGSPLSVPGYTTPIINYNPGDTGDYNLPTLTVSVPNISPQ